LKAAELEGCGALGGERDFEWNYLGCIGGEGRMRIVAVSFVMGAMLFAKKVIILCDV
jgi:hypothetical protein